MSDFFTDLESAVKRVASSAKAEVTVAAREQQVKEAFQTLGRMYYKAVKSGEPAEGEAFSEQVTRIEELLRQIDELRSNQKVPE